MSKKTPINRTCPLDVAWTLLVGEIIYVFLAAYAILSENSRHPEFWAISCLAFSCVTWYCCALAVKGKSRSVWILLPFAAALIPFFPIILIWIAFQLGGGRYGH